jgi:Caspase domain
MSGDQTTASPGLPLGRSMTLAIILGAHAWPNMPSLTTANAFALSASAFRDYLRSDAGLNLPESCIKDLFDSDLTKDQIDTEIRQFLQNHYKEETPIFTDLIIYYTGHGDFTRGDQLILKSTNHWNSDFSGYTMRQLASTVNAAARKARKIVILDCCYAAAAFEAWQMQGVGDIKKAITLQASDNFTDDVEIVGTALICACDAQEWALFKEDDLTMFSGGLMRSLRDGDVDRGDLLSIGDLYTLTRSEIITRHRSEAVAPLLHVPKGRREEITAHALFPNPAKRKEADPRWRVIEAAVQELRDQVTTQTVALQGIRSTLDIMLRNNAEEIRDDEPKKDLRERVKFLLQNPSVPDAVVTHFLSEVLREGVYIEQAIWSIFIDEYISELNAYRVRAQTEYHYANMFSDHPVNFELSYGYRPDNFPSLDDNYEIGKYIRITVGEEDLLPDGPLRIPKDGIQGNTQVQVEPLGTMVLKTEYVVLMAIGEDQLILPKRFVKVLAVTMTNQCTSVVKILDFDNKLMILRYRRKYEPIPVQGIAPGEKGFGFKLAAP